MVTDLPTKVGEAVFTKDVSIALFLIHGAEVVTVPGSGFFMDEKKGVLRISLAIAPESLTEAARRMEHAAKIALALDSVAPSSS